MQQSQRSGRLLHSQKEATNHYILMRAREEERPKDVVRLEVKTRLDFPKFAREMRSPIPKGIIHLFVEPLIHGARRGGEGRRVRPRYDYCRLLVSQAPLGAAYTAGSV